MIERLCLMLLRPQDEGCSQMEAIEGGDGGVGESHE